MTIGRANRLYMSFIGGGAATGGGSASHVAAFICEAGSSFTVGNCNWGRGWSLT